MKSVVYAMSILVISLSLSVKTYSQDVVNIFDEKTINQILYDIISSDTSIMDKDFKLVDGFNSKFQTPARRYIDTTYLIPPFFNTSDVDFYMEQIKRNRNFIINQAQLLNTYPIISKQVLNDFIDSTEADFEAGNPYNFYDSFEKEIGSIQEFSLPIFSKSGQFVFLKYVKTYSYGKNEGFFRIYGRDGDRWRLAYSLGEFGKK